ncbi:MAG: Gldg family protein [Candidatus Omnitrophica bacterium]|nr:Gldg family protein [Candidatus Omnitrophota bacterium]
MRAGALRGAGVLFRRELQAYLRSPIAAVVAVAYLLLSGGLFISQFFLIKVLDLRAFFDLQPFILAVVLPAISMRIWAEDRQLNTLELLLSLPLQPSALVLGKFLAAAAFFALLLASTWTFPALLWLLGRPDAGPIAAGYLGLFLMGAMYLALGQFISGFCREQIVAFIIGLVACQGLYLLGTEFIASTVDGWWPSLGGFLQQHLGVAGHLAAFQKGVVDGRDVAYFLLLAGVFLALNGLWMEGRLRPRARVTFAMACGLGVAIAVAAHGVLQQLPLGRADWTASKAYTVAPATRQLLRQLEVPATVKLYLSPPDKMPTAMRTLERDVRDALEELRLASGGNLHYTVSHMEASAAMAEPPGDEGPSREQLLGRKGIRPFQVQSIEADELGVRLIYASAAIAYRDRPEEIIPQIVPDTLDQFEYLVMSRIYRMTLETLPQVALLAPYAQKAVDPQVLQLLQQLGMNAQDSLTDDAYRYLAAALQREGYRFARIRLTEQEPIPPDTRALVIVDPGELNDRQRYEINRYLVEGGTLFVAAQRYQFQYAQQGRGVGAIPKPQVIGLDPLLSGWGVAVSPDILFDQESRLLTISMGGGPFGFAVPVQAPIHVFVGQSQMNHALSITGQLPPLMYLWGSALTLQDAALKAQGVTTTTLFTSSPKSWLVPLSDYDTFSPSKPVAGPQPLAVWARGTFADQYAGRPAPAWSSETPAASDKPAPAGPGAPLTPKPGQLIVTGCSEMFKEQLIGEGGHLPFIVNAVDTLVSGGQLVGIRNKQPVARALATVSPSVKAWARGLTLGVMPWLIVAAALAHAAWRRRVREAYARG